MDQLLEKSKSMKTHVEEQYKLLEKLMGDQKFEVKWDEKNAGDMAWVNKQVDHILNSLPEVKLIEAKAKGAKDGQKELETVENTLTAALDIIKNHLHLTKEQREAEAKQCGDKSAKLSKEAEEYKSKCAALKAAKAQLEKSATNIKCNTKPLA